PETSLQRVEVRNLALEGFNETRFDAAHVDFHRRVRARFLAIADREPNRVAVVPAREGVDAVEADIWARVAPLLRNAGFQVD
ncbi:MAG TPA: hypothetical protein VJ623_13345, partial [Holophagaceae bacterium]|nr:hypothetical protein [Holophagaceae bacterium]